MIVSICDDNEIGREILKELLWEYQRHRDIETLEIMEYDSPLALIKDLDRVESDVYLLDIMFPDGNGIELAKEIRLRYHHNPIIFITSSKEDTMKAFTVYALRYFVKPISQSTFFETMDYVCTMLYESGAPKYFLINTTEGRQRLRFSSIMYVERKNQSVLLTTNSGKIYESVTIRESFSNKLGPLLEDGRFVQTHVSFVVNLDSLDLYGKNYLTMQDGRRIPVSRNFYIDAKEKICAYFGQNFA